MKKKALMIAFLAIVMALCTITGATLAYLFVSTGEVVNTFSYGDINIELKEHKFVDGALTSEEVDANTTYKVVPGVTEDKDPFVRINSGSEKCYVYVTVQNNVKLDDGTVVATVNLDTSKWIKVGENTTNNTVLYRYVEVVDASSAEKTLTVFTTVSYSKDILKTNIAQVNNDTIVVKAYAHQSANVSIDAANSAAITWAGVTATTN